MLVISGKKKVGSLFVLYRTSGLQGNLKKGFTFYFISNLNFINNECVFMLKFLF